MFEDTKDAEFVRLQSEKDYFEIIKDNAIITIGMEKKNPGDYTQTIYNSRTETVKMGDSTFTAETGSEIRSIKTDQTEDIGNDVTRTIGNNRTETVTADHTEEIGGNEAVTVTGDSTLTVTGGRTEDVTGAISVSSKQTITIEATTSIELKVGANTIKIEQSGITITGAMVTVEGKGTLEAKSPMTTVKGDGMLTLKGGVTMIN
jgi:type VI secretion system secreted protein VgrG